MLDWMFGLVPNASRAIDRSPESDFWFGPVGQGTLAGVPVGEETALMYSTVFACVSKLAKTLATLPGAVSLRVDERERHRIDDPLNEVMSSGIHGDGSGVSAREAVWANTLLWGNGYAQITFTQGGVPVAITPLRSELVEQRRDENGTLFYRVRDTSPHRDVSAADMLHVPGLTLNGRTGLSVIGLQRESIGLGLAATQFGSTFFGNGAQVPGFLELPEGKKLTADAENRLVARFNERHQSAVNAHKVGFLRDGLTYKEVGMPMEDAQFIETRQYQRTEICSIFDVPPAKIQDLDKGTFSNVEQQDLVWAKDSLLPWCVKFETECKRKFFPNEPKRWRHNLAGILRGDLKTRYQSYAIARQWGWLSVNDIRAIEDMNSVDGGDEYLVPLNMVPSGTEQEEREPAAVAVQLGKPEQIGIESFAPAIRDAAWRVVNKETRALRKSFDRRSKEDTTAGFLEWSEKFYWGELHRTFVEAFSPIVESACLAIGSAFDASMVEAFASKYCGDHQNTVDGYVEADPAMVCPQIEQWREDELAELASEITRSILDTKKEEKS